LIVCTVYYKRKQLSMPKTIAKYKASQKIIDEVNKNLPDCNMPKCSSNYMAFLNEIHVIDDGIQEGGSVYFVFRCPECSKSNPNDREVHVAQPEWEELFEKEKDELEKSMEKCYLIDDYGTR